MIRFTYVVFVFLWTFCTCAKLPPSFKRCDRKQSDFNTCISNAIEDAVRQMNKPFREVGLPSLQPLEIASLTIEAGKGAVAFKQNYKDVKVFGFGETRCSEAEMNFEERTLYADCSIPSVRMDFDYEINGKILLLPIFGKGPGSIVLDKMNQSVMFNLEEYENKNKRYYRVISSKVSMNPGRITFNLENLFNGEKALADNVLKVLNENWEEVFTDVRPSYEDALGQVFSSIFNKLLSKVPINELFISK